MGTWVSKGLTFPSLCGNQGKAALSCVISEIHIGIIHEMGPFLLDTGAILM